jgi:ribosomal subunit interface protein
MNINIKATKIELTPEIKDYIQEKMDMLEKYLGDMKVINADFEVEMTTHHHQKGDIYRAEANLTLAGNFIRVDKTENDLYKAIDKVKDHLQEIIKKHKEKMIDKKRRANQ